MFNETAAKSYWWADRTDRRNTIRLKKINSVYILIVWLIKVFQNMKVENRGGSRQGAGRKPKAQEQKLIERLDAIIDKDEALSKLEELVYKGDMRAVQLYLSYRYGKPKESVDINSSEGLNINFRDLIKFVDWDTQ